MRFGLPNWWWVMVTLSGVGPGSSPHPKSSCWVSRFSKLVRPLLGASNCHFLPSNYCWLNGRLVKDQVWHHSLISCVTSGSGGRRNGAAADGNHRAIPSKQCLSLSESQSGLQNPPPRPHLSSQSWQQVSCSKGHCLQAARAALKLSVKCGSRVLQPNNNSDWQKDEFLKLSCSKMHSRQCSRGLKGLKRSLPSSWIWNVTISCN